MNLFSIAIKVPDFLRKEHTFVDAVKAGNQAGTVAALGAVLAMAAPFLGGQIDVHPWLAFLFSETGIQAVGAIITGAAAIAYRIGSSADRGILPAKPAAESAPVPSPAPKPAAIAVPDMGAAPDAAGVQRAPDAGANDDATMHAGG